MILFYRFKVVMLVFSLLMAFAPHFNAMTVGVLERRQEFATMRSLGTGRRWIAVQLFVENLILWLFTLNPGFLLGYLMAQGIGSVFNTDLLILKVVIAHFIYLVAGLDILATMMLATLPVI